MAAAACTSSGGKPTLLGISKRGDRYLRTLLVHGARSVIVRTRKREDEKRRLLKEVLDQRHVYDAFEEPIGIERKSLLPQPI